MLAQGHTAAVAPRRADRLVWGLVLVLVIGIPAFSAFYWWDRHPAPGPSLAERTVASAEAAVRAQPNDLVARNHLAAAYVAAGRAEDGIVQFGEVLKVARDNRAALLGRGLAYLAAHRLDQARADFESLVSVAEGGEMARVDPQLEQAYYEIGSIDLQQGRTAEAVVALEAALAIDGGDADALFAYGSAQIALGNLAKGVEALRQAVAFVPTGWCDPYARMADGYRQLGQNGGVAYATGMVAFCEGRMADAVAALKGTNSDAFAIDAWIGLALVSAAQGDSAVAADYYRRVLARDPGNASALIGLGQLGGADGHPALPSAAPGGSQ